MNQFQLRLFGTPRLEIDGVPTPIERRKGTALLAFLAVSGLPQRRAVLAGLLWGDHDDERAHTSLRSTLYSLNSLASEEWLQADRSTLMLRQDNVWVDVQEFLSLLSQSRSHGHSADVMCGDCEVLLARALELYTGDFLEGFSLPDSAEFEAWQLAQREWLRRELGGLLRRLAQHALENGHLQQAIDTGRRWLALDTLYEPAHRFLMRAMALNGERAEALRQYERCVQILDVELASPPDDETTQLYQAILHQQLERTPTQPGKPSGTPRGILPPLPPLVLGRADALAAIKLRFGIGQGEPRSVTVIQGWPGVGKSTIAALIAHDPEIAAHFPDGTLWASLGETPDILGELTQWASALQPGEGGSVRKIEEISFQLTAALRDRKMLLIVDDVWQTEHAAPFRVGGRGCALLFTSRLNDIAEALAPTAADVYRLSVLSDEAGFSLLEQLAPEAVRAHPDETRDLVRDLEGLPLGLHVAGRLLNAEARLGWGVAELLEELRTGASLLTARPPVDMLSDTSPTVAALLKRSTDGLTHDLRAQFALLGLFVPKPATFDLAAMSAAWAVDDPRPVARQLVDRGLLEPISGGRFQMHALLVLHARSLLTSEFGMTP